MRADDFPVDLLFLNLEDYDILHEKSNDASKIQALVSKEERLLDDLEDCLTGSMLIQASPPETAMLNVDVSAPTASLSHPSSTTSTPAPSNPGSPRPSKCGSPLSQSPSHANSENSSSKLPRHKRKSHINAELRRRSKIQRGLEEVQTLVPAVAEAMANGQKESKAAMLNKTLNYGLQLRAENKALSQEADKLRAEIQALSLDINGYQKQLPDGGAGVVPKPVVPTKSSEGSISIEKMFDDYIRARTFQNWKFWIFGMIIRPLFNSYNQHVRTSSLTAFGNSVLSWLEQHCSLVALRSGLLTTLRKLSKQSSILTAPEKLPEEAIQAALAEPESGASPMVVTPDVTTDVMLSLPSDLSSSCPSAFTTSPMVTSDVTPLPMSASLSLSSPIMSANSMPKSSTVSSAMSSQSTPGLQSSSAIASTNGTVTSAMPSTLLPSFTCAPPVMFSYPMVTSTATTAMSSVLPPPGMRSVSGVTSADVLSQISPVMSSALMYSLTSSSPVSSVESMITSTDDLDSFPC